MTSFCFHCKHFVTFVACGLFLRRVDFKVMPYATHFCSVMSLAVFNPQQASSVDPQTGRWQTPTGAKIETNIAPPRQVIAWPPHRFSQPCPARANRSREGRRWTGIRNACLCHRRRRRVVISVWERLSTPNAWRRTSSDIMFPLNQHIVCDHRPHKADASSYNVSWT